jgi:hypothetical protein
MVQLVQSGMGPILLACQTQLVNAVPSLNPANPSGPIAGSVSPAPVSLVLLVGRKNVPKFQANEDCLLQPGSFISNQECFDGSGLNATKVRRYLNLYPRNRAALDPADRDDVWLTDLNLGFFQFEDACVAALAGFWPQDILGNYLTYQEIRVANGTDPAKNDSDGMWGDSMISFEVEYLISSAQAGMIQPIVLPNPVHNVAYQYKLTEIADQLGVFSATGLPTGLSISGTGLISGTVTTATWQAPPPAGPGPYYVTIQTAGTDVNGNAFGSRRNYTLNVQ